MASLLSDLRGLIHSRFERWEAANASHPSLLRVATAASTRSSASASTLSSSLSLRESVQPGRMSMTSSSTAPTTPTSQSFASVAINVMVKKKESTVQRIKNRFRRNRGKAREQEETPVAVPPVAVASSTRGPKEENVSEENDSVADENKPPKPLEPSAMLRSIEYAKPRFVHLASIPEPC